MNVIFLKNVPPYRAGQVASVAHGYAQNFLLPRKLATLATPQAIQDAQARQRQDAAKQAHAQEGIARLQAALQGATFRIPAAASPSGTLYAALSPRSIREAIAKQLDVAVPDTLGEGSPPIKTTGSHQVRWSIAGQFVTFTIDV